MTPVGKLLGIGPKTVRWLHAIGISTREDLARVGVVKAYRQISAHEPTANLNLLWALHGGLEETHWTMLTESEKAALKAQLDAAEE